MVVQTKLTLRMDSRVIEHAKQRAKRSGKSLSRLVADYLSLLGAELPGDGTDLPPITRSLHGVLKGRALGEGDYRAHLERKHL